MNVASLTIEVRICSKGLRSRGDARSFNICRNKTDAVRACSIGRQLVNKVADEIVCEGKNSNTFAGIAGILTSRVVEDLDCTI